MNTFGKLSLPLLCKLSLVMLAKRRPWRVKMWAYLLVPYAWGADTLKMKRKNSRTTTDSANNNINDNNNSAYNDTNAE
jgi:hypothetical protein